jgi:hypothetical protein
MESYCLFIFREAAALLTPAHFFPHDVPLHSSRRSALIEWACCTSRYVLPDDYDDEFRYDRRPIGAVQGLDPQRVCYLGSASKSLLLSYASAGRHSPTTSSNPSSTPRAGNSSTSTPSTN